MPKSATGDKIIELLKSRSMRPADLATQLQISPQALHRQLLKLVASQKIEKLGTPPRVFYKLAQTPTKKTPPTNYDTHIASFIEKEFAYLDATGRYNTGIAAFEKWTHTIGQYKARQSLAAAYVRTRTETLNHFTDGYISGRHKLKNTFTDFYLEDAFFQDFYSIPQFGKTRIGCLLTMGKSGQYLPAIEELAQSGKGIVEKIIKRYSIESVAFLPHSIPRKLAFLHEYARLIDLQIPTVRIVKAFGGGIPVAQKTLTKLQERIDNAEHTIFIHEKKISYQSILLIDDAVGSGATINMTAKKLRQEFNIQKIYAFAIAGSYKGFEVIAEI
ncbi:MAG: hypothetical protein LDLANPLL_02907 [Turneriella sp.]|nr:hypothetical protein [Turneriella sp.]